MMKKKFIYQLLIMLIVCNSLVLTTGPLKVDADGELMPNPDFEVVSNDLPEQWTGRGTGSIESISNGAFVRSGSYSVRLDDPSAVTSMELQSSHIPVTPGTTYRASVYAFDVGGTSHFYLEYWNSSDVRIDVQYVSNPSQNQWNRLDIMREAPSGTAYATVLLYLHQTNVGTSYFDSSSLQAVPSSLGPNLGFEEEFDGKPLNWSDFEGNGRYESETGIVYSGEYSVKLDDPSSIHSTGLRSKQLPVMPNQEYRASVMAYNVAGVSQLYLEYWNSEDERIDVGIGTNSTTEIWQKLVVDRVAPPDAAYATILIYLHGVNVGTAYFDEAAFGFVNAQGSNFGFEEVLADKPTNWIDFEGNGLYQAESGTVYSGTHSVKLVDPSAVNATGLRSMQQPVTPWEEYEASVMAYNVSGVSQLYLEYWNSENERIDVVIGTNATIGSWQEIKLNRVAPPDAAYATILIYLHGVNQGTVYFDEAKFGLAAFEPVREFSLVVNDHPRLYFTSSELSDLRAKANDTVNKVYGLTGNQLWEILEKQAQVYLNETSVTIDYYNDYSLTFPLPPQEPGPLANPPGYNAGQYPYWTALSRAIEVRLETLSLAYAVTQDQDFADKAKAYMLAMAGWESWNDSTTECDAGYTCLDTAHITLGVSMAYDVLYNQLTSTERTQVETALETNGLIPLYVDSTYRLDNNIEMLRASALGVGATVMLGKLPNAKKYLTRATNYMNWYMDERMNSGKSEGLLYSSYSMDNMLMAIDSISRTTGLTEFINHPLLNDFIVRWANYFLAPGGGGLAAFSDSQYDNYFGPTMSIINNWLDNGHSGWYLNETRPESTPFMRFLYFNPQSTITEPSDMPSSTVLDEIGWAALRSGWDKKDTLFAFVSNNSKLGHNHYDQNSFQIATNRSWIAADPGYQDFSPGPINEFTTRMGHSTILVDGQGQSELGGGSLAKGMLSPSYDYIKGSAADAYGNPKLERFDRHVVYVNSEYFVIFDDLKANVPRTFDWILYSGRLSEFAVDGEAAAPGQTTQGNNLFIHNDRASLTAKFLSSGTLPITTQQYTGAESYGYFSKITSQAPATDYKYMTVIKAAPIHIPGLYRATNLLPEFESSGKVLKVVEAVDTQLVFYRAEEIGDYMTFEFDVETAGTYSLDTLFIQSPLYGKVQAYLDDVLIGSVFDGYDEEVQAAAPFRHGDVTLQAGTHTIRYEIVGKNAASGNYFMGIDAIKLIEFGETELPAPEFEKELDAELIQGTGVIGASVARSGSNPLLDLVLFKTGTGSYQALDVESDADQAVVTKESGGTLAGISLTQGKFVKYDSVTFLQAQAPFNAVFEYGAQGAVWTGTVETDTQLIFDIHSATAGVEVTIDGQPLGVGDVSYNSGEQLLSFVIPIGRHTVVVEEQGV
ncbi:heparinase II/III family protein [Paenibacillus sp. PAMC21692]|uniref:heparinase II/III domain-containing protein n=1 Tax=Paenibacillus sp. PAMC21692 TaxID=2762320 RepID=UPI00164E4FAD|nr:heparinase II/III family protein [Paenibacillus sp. PAMC21692]QNK56291.1 heparinase II/III family protein [Paenibacillus sp. PAMC21692]